MGEKSRSGKHEQDLGPWPSPWMRFIKEERHKRGVAEDRPHGYQSPADLEEALVALVAGTELEHCRWHCVRKGKVTTMGLGSAQPNRHACWRMGIAMSGKTLHKDEARMEIHGARGTAGAGMWRERVSPCVWRLVLKAVVAGMVTKGAQGTGSRDIDAGTDWTGRQKKEKDPVGRTTRGGVGGNGHMTAAWIRSHNWERPLVYACELWVFAMCPALRGSTVSYAGDAYFPKHSLEYCLNFWSRSKKNNKIAELGEELDMDLVRVHNVVCDQVQAKERSKVSEAVSQLLLGVCDAAGDRAMETIPVVVSCLTELAEKGIDPEDEESYYNDEEDHGEVDPAVAARGLGKVGNVPIQDTRWSCCVPEDLRSRYQRWRDDLGGVGSSDGVGVREMLDALVRDGAVSKHTNVRAASGKAQVRPKSNEKCAFIVNCVKQNACDGRRPRGFQLPQIEHLRDSILLGGRQKL